MILAVDPVEKILYGTTRVSGGDPGADFTPETNGEYYPRERGYFSFALIL